MATRKCGNIYFRKYFMAARKFTNIFVLLLILMVGSRDTLFLLFFTKKMYEPTDSGCSQMSTVRRDESPDHYTGKKKVFYKWNTW